MNKKKLRLMYGVIFGIVLIGIFSSFVFAGSFNPEDERIIGYEFLDNNKVVHIWNTQDDYYFDKSSGIQLTNHYNDYWTRNIFCIGYYNNDEWHKIKCADELINFQKSIESDDNSVSATLWKEISFIKNDKEYNMNLSVNYYLGLNDENLSITISGKNTGIDIPVDLGFAWKITDWDIPSNETDDYLEINGSGYNTKGNYDLTFKDMEESYFKGRDSTYDFGGEFLRVDWNENLNYAVKMFGNGIQEDFYVALLINAGHFNSLQEKSTTFQWIDALVIGTNCGFVTAAPTTDPSGFSFVQDGYSETMKDTSPATAGKIVEFGWWCDTASEAANFEVGLYADSAGTPGSRLYVDNSNAKGTTAGWKSVVVDWTISPNTAYWLAVQVDNTASPTNGNYVGSGGFGMWFRGSQTSLLDPFGGSQFIAAGAFSYYAVWEAALEETSPTYSLNQTNTTEIGKTIKFSILYNDDTALNPNGQYIFSTNNTGTWVNESVINFTATPNWANVTKTLNSTVDETIGYRWYADDNAGNNNNTPIYTLTVTSADTCTYTSGNWAVDCSDNCVISSPVNLGGNDISIIGTGTFTMTSDVSNYGTAIIQGTDSSNKCIVTCLGGCLKN